MAKQRIGDIFETRITGSKVWLFATILDLGETDLFLSQQEKNTSGTAKKSQL